MNASSLLLNIGSIIVVMIATWWKLTTLELEDKQYFIWNHGRYSTKPTNTLKSGWNRHPCTKGGCNASIYVLAGSFRGKTDHSDHEEHSCDNHEDWGGAAMFREQAISSINLDIKIGKNRADAYDSYVFSHPNQSYALNLSGMRHRLTSDVIDYPSAPDKISLLVKDLKSKPKWSGNLYEHLDREYEEKLEEPSVAKALRQFLTAATIKDLEKSLSQWKFEMTELKFKITLTELAVTIKHSRGYGSDFFLTHNDTYSLLLFGEEGHFDILQTLELWLADGTFDTTPSLGNLAPWIQEWIISGCVPSGIAGIQSECFPTFVFLFARGDGVMSEGSYTECMNLLLQEAENRSFNLNIIKHRFLGDFEMSMRNGIVASDLVLYQPVVETCGYHFCSRWKNGFKKFDLWTAYLHNKKVKEYLHTFLSIRAVPLSMILEAFTVMRERRKTDIPKRYQKSVLDFCKEYAEPTWVGTGARFARAEWNEYRKEIRANNHAESLNNSRQRDVGTHPEFFHWIWNSKKYSAKHLARWRRFKTYGFQRQRKVKEHLKNLSLVTLWDLIGSKSIGLYDYMRCVSYLSREKWDKVKDIVGDLDTDNDKM